MSELRDMAEAINVAEGLTPEGLTRWTWLTGMVFMPRFTGQILVDAEGWSYLEWTDKIVVDAHGREVSREKVPPVVRWRGA